MSKLSKLTPRRLLFIGNSFTARNDLPARVAELASQRGATVEHRLISAGGASLRRHWNAGDATELIRAGQFDAVVLQEQSTLPIKNADRMHESIRLFHELIQAAGAETVLYMTWARKHAPETQRAISDAYTSIAGELDSALVPVGLAWEEFLRDHAEPALHDRDQSHPTPAGSYLAACVFLGVLFGENPTGIASVVAGVTDPQLTLLQKTAWKTCRAGAGRR